MIHLFSKPWDQVPLVMIDTETTGIRLGIDRAVSCALVRFEGGKQVDWFSSLINPCGNIPLEATAVHGIQDRDVQNSPTIEEFFSEPRVKQLLSGAQPAAYNAPFDREMVWRPAFEDWSWPWIDPLVFVKHHDRFAKGPGRHKLDTSCERHGIVHHGAHSAQHDALAAGELFYALIPKLWAGEQLDGTLGHLLKRQAEFAAQQWHDLMNWKASQPNA